MRLLVACLTVHLCLAVTARAVIIINGDGSGNVTAPTDDPGFANVGVRGGGTAVYLGNGWAITAVHVGDGLTWFNNTAYNEVPGSAVQLPNPAGNGYTPYTDLEVFQIQSPPNLPSIALSSSAPAPGWQVTMIGAGRDRLADEAYWTSAWVPSSTPAAYAGYIWAQESRTIRWGTNVIDSVGLIQGVGSNTETSFSTSFSSSGTTSEAQGASGDSGGGVFHKDSITGAWNLTGLMFAVSAVGWQPSGTSVFGDLTYSADLSVYRNEINQIIALPGDVNYDGVVNGLDMTTLAAHWLQTGIGINDPPGDANHDGVVNGLDVALIGSNWNLSDGSGASQDGLTFASPTVPEPSTFALALAGVMLAAFLCFRARRAACRS